MGGRRASGYTFPRMAEHEEDDDEDRTVQAPAPLHAATPQPSPLGSARSAPLPFAEAREEEPADDFTDEASTVERPVPASVASIRLKTPLAEDFDPEDTATTRGPAAGLYGKALDAPASSRLPVEVASPPRALPRRPAPEEPPRVFGGVSRAPESGKFRGPKPARRAIPGAEAAFESSAHEERPEDSITAQAPPLRKSGHAAAAVAASPTAPAVVEDPGPDAPDESITVMTRDPGGPGPPASTTAPFAEKKASSAPRIAAPEPLPADLDGDSVTTENPRETRPTVPLSGSLAAQAIATTLEARRPPPARPPLLEPESLGPPEEEDILTGVGKPREAPPDPPPDDPSITATMSPHVAAGLRTQSSDPGSKPPARPSERRAESAGLERTSRRPAGVETPESMARTGQRQRSPETPESMARTGQRPPETPDSLARTSQKHAIDGGGVRSALAFGATSLFEPPTDVKQAMRDGHSGSLVAARSGKPPQSTGLMQALIDERVNAGMGTPAPGSGAPKLFNSSPGPPSLPGGPGAPSTPPSANLLRALADERASIRQPIPTPSGTVLPALDPSAEALTFAPPSFDPSSTAVLRGEVRLPQIQDSIPDAVSSPPGAMGAPPLPPGPPLQIHPLLSRQPPPAPVGEPRWTLIVAGFALAAILIPVATWVGIRAARESSVVPPRPVPAGVSQSAEGRAEADPRSRTFRPRRR